MLYCIEYTPTDHIKEIVFGDQVMRQFGSLSDAVRFVCGEGAKVTGQRSVGGGDINNAYRLEISDGSIIFMKENTAVNIGFFSAEAKGLAAIRSTGAIGTPDVLALGTDHTRSFLLLSYIGSGSRIKGFFERFGEDLANMHKSPCDEYTPKGKFGFTDDNYIGAGYQENTVESSWIAFFKDHRLLPQIDRAKRYFDTGDLARIDKLIAKLDDILIEPDNPALLHGDLWSGNYMTGPDGKAWLIDPAVYVGHPEADIAMTELFGGFAPQFYDAYFETAGRHPGYEDRRDLYNLYHMLNHLNLFGGSYLPAVRRIINRYV